ncbi:MAG: hypothetical protein ACLP5H_23660 [Desulfomonilaceae bacterium]
MNKKHDSEREKRLEQIQSGFDEIYLIMNRCLDARKPRDPSSAAKRGWETRRWRRFYKIVESLNRSKTLDELYEKLLKNHEDLAKWTPDYPKDLNLPVFGDGNYPTFYEDFIACGFNLYNPGSNLEPDSWDDSRFLVYVWEMGEWFIYDEQTVRLMTDTGATEDDGTLETGA